MVALIKCSYCKKGNHTDCMKDYEPPAPDVIGGKICTCCRGLTDLEKQRKEEQEPLDNLVKQSQELDLYDFPESD